MSAPKPPMHLSKDARAWWSEVIRVFELEDHHRRLLTLAAECWDRAVQARKILAREGITYRDRFGKPRKHPAVSVEEQARLGFAKLLRELDLEGEPNPGYRRTHAPKTPNG